MKRHSAFKTTKFERSCKVVNGKATDLCKLGKGKKPWWAHALTAGGGAGMGKSVWMPHTREAQLHSILYCKPAIRYHGAPGAPPNLDSGHQVGQKSVTKYLVQKLEMVQVDQKKNVPYLVTPRHIRSYHSGTCETNRERTYSFLKIFSKERVPTSWSIAILMVAAVMRS